MSYRAAAPQDLPMVDGPSVTVTVINKSSGSLEFFDGPLKGLILAPWEIYQAELPLGFQVHRWSQEVFHKGRVMNFRDKIVVTHRSRTLSVLPPPRSDLYYVHGPGSLDLQEY
jgi:hypothetical protein